jgi:hypothetical protein
MCDHPLHIESARPSHRIPPYRKPQADCEAYSAAWHTCWSLAPLWRVGGTTIDTRARVLLACHATQIRA